MLAVLIQRAPFGCYTRRWSVSEIEHSNRKHSTVRFGKVQGTPPHHPRTTTNTREPVLSADKLKYPSATVLVLLAAIVVEETLRRFGSQIIPTGRVSVPRRHSAHPIPNRHASCPCIFTCLPCTSAELPFSIPSDNHLVIHVLPLPSPTCLRLKPFPVLGHSVLSIPLITPFSNPRSQD